MNPRNHTKKFQPVDIQVKQLADLTFDEIRQIHCPIAIHAFWSCWDKDDPTEFIFITLKDGKREPVVLHIARFMREVCGGIRVPDFELNVAVLLMANRTMGDFFALWDDLISRYGPEVPLSHRSGIDVFQNHLSEIDLSPFLVGLIRNLNQTNIYGNAHDHPARSESRVAMSMAEVDILLRREHPDVFVEKPR